MSQFIINTKNPNQANFVILGANYDKTSSFGKGADKGPKAIIDCLNNQIEFYERFTKTEPVANYKIGYFDLGNLNKLTPGKMVERVAVEFKKYYQQKKFILMLGGEHSISNGVFQVLSKIEKPENITILQIDAHMDMRDTDADYNDKPWGKYAHSTVMRRACELGFNITQVGVRAYSKQEYDFVLKQKNIKFFEWGKGKIITVNNIINSIKIKNVYLTIDVDGIDPSAMPATGTPVQGGLEWYYTLNLIGALFKKKNVLAADIVEVAPRPYDTLTEYGAAQLVYNIIAGINGQSTKRLLR